MLLENGLALQWFSDTYTGEDPRTVNLPRAFEVACHSVVGNPLVAATAAMVTLHSVGLTSISYRVRDDLGALVVGPITVYFLAIGA